MICLSVAGFVQGLSTGRFLRLYDLRDHDDDHERGSCSLLTIDMKRDLASLSPLHAVLDEMYAGNCVGFCAS